MERLDPAGTTLPGRNVAPQLHEPGKTLPPLLLTAGQAAGLVLPYLAHQQQPLLQEMTVNEVHDAHRFHCG